MNCCTVEIDRILTNPRFERPQLRVLAKEARTMSRTQRKSASWIDQKPTFYATSDQDEAVGYLYSLGRRDESEVRLDEKVKFLLEVGQETKPTENSAAVRSAARTVLCQKVLPKVLDELKLRLPERKTAQDQLMHDLVLFFGQNELHCGVSGGRAQTNLKAFLSKCLAEHERNLKEHLTSTILHYELIQAQVWVGGFEHLSTTLRAIELIFKRIRGWLEHHDIDIEEEGLLWTTWKDLPDVDLKKQCFREDPDVDQERVRVWIAGTRDVIDTDCEKILALCGTAILWSVEEGAAHALLGLLARFQACRRKFLS